MRPKQSTINAVCLVLVCLASYCGAGWQTLDVPGSISTELYSISGNKIVGRYKDNSGFHGCVYDGENWTTLDYPNGNGTLLSGIDGDRIVGAYNFNNPQGPIYGFLYDPMGAELWKTLSYSGASQTTALGIDGDKIVGSVYFGGSSSGYLYDESKPAGSKWFIFDYPGASSTSANNILGDIIVGNYYNPSIHGYLLNGQDLIPIDYPEAFHTNARGIDGNYIVGHYHNASGVHGYLYDGSNWATLDYPDSSGTELKDIEGDVIFGFYSDSSGGIHGCIYTPDTPVDLLLGLETLIVTLGLDKGTTKGLVSKLDNVIKKLEDDNANNDIAAVNGLYAFINHVEAQSGKKIDPDDADGLILIALDIIDLLETE